jgi:uncharacterized protein YoxC
MGNLAYLLAAVGVIVFAIGVIALRNRTPRTVDSGIRAHQRHMDALSMEARRALTARRQPSARPAAGARPQRRSTRE